MTWLVEMRAERYDSEDRLQELLARYPDLLAGSQMTGGGPRRWMLVCREAGIPKQDGGADQWSADHLFLDQEGVPTIVEVKRSTDTRIRREVVGQMLDYAANAVRYWPAERLRADHEAACGAEGRRPEEALTELLGPDPDPDAFWGSVGEHLPPVGVRRPARSTSKSRATNPTDEGSGRSLPSAIALDAIGAPTPAH
jgi:hypothetical protein